jgi:hypothetical protein
MYRKLSACDTNYLTKGGNMKRGLLFLSLVMVMVLVFIPCVYATNFDTLKTNFAQGGNPSITKTIVGSGQIYVGPCRIISINYFSSTAGDKAAIYNTADPYYPYDLEFEMGISANNTSDKIYPNAPFENGISIYSSSLTSVTTVVFDY